VLFAVVAVDRAAVATVSLNCRVEKNRFCGNGIRGLPPQNMFCSQTIVRHWMFRTSIAGGGAAILSLSICRVSRDLCTAINQSLHEAILEHKFSSVNWKLV
jgi:hypothetical protein